VHLNFDTILGSRRRLHNIAQIKCGAVSRGERRTGDTDVHTADFSYMRMRKEEYSDKARKFTQTEGSKSCPKGEVFVYFKHEETPECALHAEELL